MDFNIKGKSSDVSSMVEWLECQDCDQHNLSSKLTRAILLCPWERYLMALFPAW